jgi:hypothetical protein
VKAPLVISLDPKQLSASEASVILASTDSPVPCPDADPIEDIRVRAETVSSILKDMMDRQPSRHWGINE